MKRTKPIKLPKQLELHQLASYRPDPFSSGPWFPGWWTRPPRPTRSPPVMPSTFVHLRPFDVNAVPGPRWAIP